MDIVIFAIYLLGTRPKRSLSEDLELWAKQAESYLSALHLLPAVERENKRYSILALAAGVLVAAIIVVSKA